ncbi:MAG: pyrroline-5-carboxylate reductase [Pelosinus sp.]|nr:pyrroline-5-carboxylate reductase [Pelosinus sp.]
MLQGKKIGFIGSGMIAEAICRGIIKSGLMAPKDITMNDISKERLAHLESELGVSVGSDNAETAGKVDILFLTVKPQVIHKVLDTMATSVTKRTIVISVVAGVTLAALEERMPGIPVVRVMPNTPIAVGEGMAAIALGQLADEAAGKIAAQIFSAAGKAVILSESAMDAVTGLSGSGPGYAFVIIDALADAGVRVGLTRQQSIMLAAQTLLGSAKMVLETGEHPAQLRDKVTSPAGTTIAGISVLEQYGVRAAIIDAVIAATERSSEMGKK